MVKDDMNVEILFEDFDDTDLGEVLRKYNEVSMLKNVLVEKLEILKNKIKLILKERSWNSFTDEKSKISVSVSSEQRESVNKKTLKMILNEEQYNKVITKTSFEKIMIITPKDRARLDKYARK